MADNALAVPPFPVDIEVEPVLIWALIMRIRNYEPALVLIITNYLEGGLRCEYHVSLFSEPCGVTLSTRQYNLLNWWDGLEHPRCPYHTCPCIEEGYVDEDQCHACYGVGCNHPLHPVDWCSCLE